MDIREEFKRDIRNGNYEKDDEGMLFLPKSNIRIGGAFTHSVNGGPEVTDHNLITNEGLNHFLDVTLGSGAKLATWYIAIGANDYATDPTDAASNISTRWGENNDFVAPTARKEFIVDGGDPTGQALSNFDSKASFSMTGTITIYGAFLISDVTVGTSTGTCVASSRFAAARALGDTDEFLVGYSISAADA